MLCQGNALCEDGNHGSKAIQEQRPGEDRVATNAATPQSTWWQDNQHALRRIVFRLQDATGVRANVVLLRPVEWLQTQNVRGGGTTWLDLAEMGICGAVNVVCIEPCPQIPSGPGRLITGWFEHFDAVVYDLRVAGEEEPLGVTATHPFWSVDRQAWISVIDLHIGERLQARDGTTPRVESLTLRSEREPVYNVEVEGDHCYRVGTQGLLVHNQSAGGRVLTNAQIQHDVMSSGCVITDRQQLQFVLGTQLTATGNHPSGIVGGIQNFILLNGGAGFLGVTQRAATNLNVVIGRIRSSMTTKVYVAAIDLASLDQATVFTLDTVVAYGGNQIPLANALTMNNPVRLPATYLQTLRNEGWSAVEFTIPISGVTGLLRTTRGEADADLRGLLMILFASH